MTFIGSIKQTKKRKATTFILYSNLLQENDDVIQELRTLHDKEKNLLMEENNKLSAELERSIEVFEY